MGNPEYVADETVIDRDRISFTNASRLIYNRPDVREFAVFQV